MIRHDRLDEAARDRAVLHVLGATTPAETTAYERHLDACDACSEEVRTLREVLDGLNHLVPSATPPPELKARLFARVRGDRALPAWKTWQPIPSSESMTLVRARDGEWEPTGVAGVEARRLFLDAANDRVTMLVRMAPGTDYPAHRHAGFEECYVLEGDLLVGDERMRAGDYQRAEGGSLHGTQSTEGGCLLFIVSSLHDEPLDTRPS